MRVLFVVVAIGLGIGSLPTQAAVGPTKTDMSVAKDWTRRHIVCEADALPFSFVYGGVPSSEHLRSWRASRSEKLLDDERRSVELTYTDPASGLEVRCASVVYRDFPTVEWTVYLKNTGKGDTPVIESLRALDATFARSSGSDVILRRQRGDTASPSSYEPVQSELEPGKPVVFSPGGGRPTSGEAPYYNLELGDGGVIIAGGWPGQWESSFAMDSPNSRVRVTFGQELTHFRLRPGEEVRTPMVVLQFWKGGDWIRSQNVWRRWMKAHNMPKPGGHLPEPMLLASSSRAYMEMVHADEASQIMFMDRFREEGIKLDCWWMDAGWYGNEIPVRGEWPIGSYYDADATRFPRGLAPISEHAHANGLKSLLWFEPENIYPGTWIMNGHPEYVLKTDAYNHLLDLGNPEAMKWRTNTVDKALKKAKADIYRQDFNMEPLPYWRKHDAEDRQGITEIRHIEGYLAFWDELQRRHPDMLIDSCASGGRRNELEAMRRAVPLWRSDYAYAPVGHQCMTYGLSLWLPYHGTGTVAASGASYYGGGVSPVDPYSFWSNAGGASLVLGIDVREKAIDYGTLRKLIDEWRSINKLYCADYYPLTPYSASDDQWIAWQFDSPESGEGMVEAFRRDQCKTDSIVVKLRGLAPDRRYEVRNVTSNESRVIAGKELMDAGLAVTSAERPGAVVLKYTVSGE